MDHNTQKHTLKIFRWEEGLLKIEEHYTNSFKDAINLSRTKHGQSKKIYTESGELVFCDNEIGNFETYA